MTLKIDFLKKKLAILNKIFWIGFFSKKWTSYINKKKTNLVLYSVSKEITPLIKKYSEIKPPTSSIGKKVWVFWYAGVKNSPLESNENPACQSEAIWLKKLEPDTWASAEMGAAKSANIASGLLIVAENLAV